MVEFLVRRTVAELRGVKVAKFSNFGLFSPYKTHKKVPFGDQPTAQELHRRMITIFPCGSRRSKRVPSGSEVFLRLLVEELGTPKLAQIFAYGKWLYPYKMLLHCASDLDQRCLKRAILMTDVLSHQMSSPLPPKSLQNSILWTF